MTASDPDPQEYPRFARAARRLTGVDLEQYRREQTERRVRALARRRAADGLFEYLLLLRRSEEERQLFRDHVTINVSRLWRNPEHWEQLDEVVLAPLASRARGLRAWSAGCSYGAEPCTLAMLWLDRGSAAPIRIDATDIDEGSIERARLGRFTEDDVRDVPDGTRDRWLEPVDGGWAARPAAMRCIDFRVADIFEATPTDRYDLVVCRNMVIYHTPERRDDIHRRLARSLRAGGWLMVGATERVTRPGELGLRPELPFLYRRLEGGAAP